VIDELASAARLLALFRGLYFDLPLMWVMELSRYYTQALEAQAEHWSKVAGCSDVRAAVSEQTRFVREMIDELYDEASALTREVDIAIAPE
jgi:hypothetical protein